MNKNYVRIFDTTLRDGEQSPGFSMNLDEKLRIARQLEVLGVDVIEAGFPAASPEDFAAVKAIATHVKKPEICGLARAMESDIRTTWDAIKGAEKPRIHTFIATSPIHMEYKLKKTPDQIVEMAIKAVTLAKSLCDRVDFSPEDAGRSDKDFLVRIITEAIKAGADVINIPDTVGYNEPEEFGVLIKYLIDNVPNSDEAIFATHCHDDLGLATANSLAGVLNGARQIECTINGIGERAGNCSLEEVVMNLKTRKDFFDLDTGIDTTKLYASSHLVQQITGQKVQSNKAIVGKNAFAHESGIHQDGMLKNRETYEIMTPEMVGVKETEIVLGKHSGRAALLNRLQELGYQVKEEEVLSLFERFKAIADKKKKIEDSDLDSLMMNAKHHNGHWKLKSFSVESIEGSIPNAEIELINEETQETRKAQNKGTGMVDAAYKCLEEMIGSPGTLKDFHIESVTDGIDAQAVVNVQFVDEEGISYSGKSGDTDITKAAVEAYINAVGARKS